MFNYIKEVVIGILGLSLLLSVLYIFNQKNNYIKLENKFISYQLENSKLTTKALEKQAELTKRIESYESKLTDIVLDNINIKEQNEQLESSLEAANTANTNYINTLGSLRNKLKQAERNSINGETGTTTPFTNGGPSEQDRDTFDMFIYLLTRHSRELTEVGNYATKLVSAGLTCERIYDEIREEVIKLNQFLVDSQ